MYTCTVHTQYSTYTCTVHTQYSTYTCTVHTQYSTYTCTVHTQYSTCTVHTHVESITVIIGTMHLHKRDICSYDTRFIAWLPRFDLKEVRMEKTVLSFDNFHAALTSQLPLHIPNQPTSY